jgi:hypothetical protein
VVAAQFSWKTADMFEPFGLGVSKSENARASDQVILLPNITQRGRLTIF